MKTRFIRNIALAGVLTVTAAACDHSLDITPKYDVVSEKVYQDFNNYKPILAKLYAGYAVTGQQGPAGRPDIGGIDEGFSNYLRQYWQAQELTTDEAVIGWNDGNLRDLHDMDWTAGNEFLRALYDRVFYQVSLTNEFIRETSNNNLEKRGITGANLEEAKRFRAEARFLRALSYWHALDLYGNVPFVTDEDRVGSFFPNQTNRVDLFNYVVKELQEIENELGEPGFEYGRADKAAAWTLLTKLFLNAEVYTGQGRYVEAVTYASKVIDSGKYQLEEEYAHLFLADNHTSREIIFPITFDGRRTNTWGGMTYLVHAPVGGNMKAEEDFGINGGWVGLRTTKNIVNLFPNPNGTPDERAMFHTSGQNIEIDDLFTFTDGYPITKYRNVTRAGAAGSDPGGDHPDTDFPMFRLADVYLMYAEAVKRGGGGSEGIALGYVNELRRRAYSTAGGTVRPGGIITQGQLTLDFIIDERARELKWEGHRRTDLIRYNRFTSASYVWPWKGAVKEGRGVEEFRRIFPIPSTDLTANPNLVQNPGYSR